MHLGTTVIKTVNTSKPQLFRATTAQSATASSDEYFSVTEYASNSSDKSPITAIRYETPPSRKLSPAPERTQGSEMTLPQRPNAIVPAPLNVRFSKIRSIRQIPPDSNAKAPEDLSPPTPGMDDSPYIRFAIDQLTRDEELVGRGRQGSIANSEYPVHRIVPDEGLGYYNSGPVTEPLQQSKPPGRSGSVRESIPRHQFDDHRRSEPRQHQIPQHTPLQNGAPVQPPSPERLIPVDQLPPGFPETGFIPLALRSLSLLITIFTILLMISALIFCGIWSLRHHGLWNYDNAQEGRYFVFEYLPQLCGIIIILWLYVVQASIRRTLPFIKMSDEQPADRILQDTTILPANFVTPDLSYFGNGEKVLGICEITFWFINFTIPLLSCAFQTKLYNINGHEFWRWTGVQGVIWTLVVMYFLLVITLFLVMARFMKCKSPLGWDPVSMADLISMFQRSNVLTDYDRSEISGSMKTQIPARRLRLGYWKTSKSPEIFYTIGEENGPLRQYSMDRRELGEKSANDSETDPWDLEAQRYSNASSFVRNIHSPFVRYRWAPWFLRDSAIVAWIVTAFVLWIAFVIVSFAKRAIQEGFLPLLPTMPDDGGFSPSNFLYSFLPSLLGMFLFLAWQPIDAYFRAVQPFYSLSHPRGATATDSLLLSYPSCLPIETTILAVSSGHYKVAWTSTISLISAVIPILSGGMFTCEYYPSTGQIFVTTSLSAFYLLIAILFLYTISFLAIWPTRRRYLPHKFHTLSDLVSFIYQSNILRDSTFRQPQSKADLVARLVTAPMDEDLTGGKRSVPRYAFGVYIGRDGREHLGIDRVERPGSADMLITTAGKV